jgi:hypothetical protein
MGKLSVDLEVSAPAAMTLLRAYAYGAARTVDDVAGDVLGGHLQAADLQAG